jgi:hypothetical protein
MEGVLKDDHKNIGEAIEIREWRELHHDNLGGGW